MDELNKDLPTDNNKINVITGEKDTNPYIWSIVFTSLILLSIAMILGLYNPFQTYLTWIIKPLAVILAMLIWGTFLLTSTRTKLDWTTFFVLWFWTILYWIINSNLATLSWVFPYLMLFSLIFWIIWDYIYPYFKDFMYNYQSYVNEIKILKAKSSWISKKYAKNVSIVEKKTIIKETNITKYENNTNNTIKTENKKEDTFIKDDYIDNEDEEIPEIVKTTKDEVDDEIYTNDNEKENINIEGIDFWKDEFEEKIDLIWELNEDSDDWFWVLSFDDEESDNELFVKYFEEKELQKTLSIIDNKYEILKKNYYYIKNT